MLVDLSCCAAYLGFLVGGSRFPSRSVCVCLCGFSCSVLVFAVLIVCVCVRVFRGISVSSAPVLNSQQLRLAAQSFTCMLRMLQQKIRHNFQCADIK